LSREVQTYFGYNGVFYVDWRRRERLDRKIKALENELVKLKERRRKLYP